MLLIPDSKGSRRVPHVTQGDTIFLLFSFVFLRQGLYVVLAVLELNYVDHAGLELQDLEC